MLANADYYDKLKQVLPGAERSYGGVRQIVPAICPFCGKSNDRDFHSSYGPIFDGDYGFKCFSCGEAVSLHGLYVKLTGDNSSLPLAIPAVRTLPATKERARAYWRKNAASLVEAYTRGQERYAAWERYKGISAAIVDKYHLGLGVLPQSRFRDVRLIVPIMQRGAAVMLRGRRIAGDGPKWTSAGGVSPSDIQLPFVENVKSDIIFIVENPIDAILINEHSAASAVAALSTNYWYPHWTARLKELAPSIVITAYDNDLVGEGGDALKVIKVARERIAKIHALAVDDIRIRKVETNAGGWRIGWASKGLEGVLSIPAPAGVLRRNELLKAGIQVASMPWQQAADKCDIGDLWEAYRREHNG